MSVWSRPPHFLREALRWSEPWGLAIDGASRVLVRHVLVADDSRARRMGLLGRDALATDSALLLAPCQGIHTFGMRFPIDVVCLARDGTALKVVEAVGPRRIVVAWRAFAVVELSAGTCRVAGLAAGDIVRPFTGAAEPAGRLASPFFSQAQR